MDLQKRVEAALEDGNNLPAGPAVMTKIDELCRDKTSSARDLGKVLQLDTALTSRILKQVNSSFYGLSATIKTVTHAVVILGFQDIKNIAFSIPVANLFEGNFSSTGIDIQSLWDTSIEIACLARRLSYHVKYQVPEQVFVSGILADTGMIILNNIIGEEYAEVVDSSPDPESLPTVEEDQLGVSHLTVGKLLAEKWKFPPELVDAIYLHHNPVENGEAKLDPSLLYAARALQRGIASDFPVELVLASIPEPVRKVLHLTTEVAQEMYDKAPEEFGAARQMLSS